MRRFREYEDGREANLRIFEFYGSSNNRDGLAVRAAAAGLLKRDEENKILIVLSDGRPNDIVVNRPNSRNPSLISVIMAQKIRQWKYGICEMRVYPYSVFLLGRKGIFRRSENFRQRFCYIRRIDNFSAVVGRYLKKQLEETCN